MNPATTNEATRTLPFPIKTGASLPAFPNAFLLAFNSRRFTIDIAKLGEVERLATWRPGSHSTIDLSVLSTPGTLGEVGHTNGTRFLLTRGSSSRPGHDAGGS